MSRKRGMLVLGVVSGILILYSVIVVTKEVFWLHEQIAQVVLEDGDVLFVDTAQTLTQKIQGLSGTQAVPRDGLLFVYETPQDVGIWMKDMNYPIDIVWIADGKVVYLVEGAQPDDSPDRAVYRAGRSVSFVLELPVGDIERLDLKLGASVSVKY